MGAAFSSAQASAHSLSVYSRASPLLRHHDDDERRAATTTSTMMRMAVLVMTTASELHELDELWA